MRTLEPRLINTVALVAFAAFIPLVRASTVSPEVKALAMLAYITFYLGVIYPKVFQSEKKLEDLHQSQNHVVDRLDGTIDWLKQFGNSTRPARKQELYPVMSDALRKASKRVKVTYYNHRSPDQSKGEDELKYHQLFNAQVHERTNVEFQRLISYGPEDSVQKRQWMAIEHKLAQSCDNYEVRFVRSDEPSHSSRFNVAVFDDVSVLIDPCRTNDGTRFRDVHFSSGEITEMWSRHFEMVWSVAEKLMPAPNSGQAPPPTTAQSKPSP